MTPEASSGVQVGPYRAEFDERDGHITIWREDGQPCDPTWYELWRVKNLIVGTEALAVEIFPSGSALVDGQNQRHLWVVPSHVQVPCLKRGVLFWGVARRKTGRRMGARSARGICPSCREEHAVTAAGLIYPHTVRGEYHGGVRPLCPGTNDEATDVAG